MYSKFKKVQNQINLEVTYNSKFLDLKPSNLAITEECDLTVLDFGLARTVSTTSDNLTAYVISRWYRSPEVIFWNNVSYNEKADIWSVG